MRILLVSYFFPPYNTMGAVRVGKTARYLMAQGHDMRVLTADKQSWKGPLQTTLRLEIPEERVIYAGSPVVNRLSSLFIRLLTGGESSNGHLGWLPFAFLHGRRLLQQWKPDLIFASGLPFSAFLVAHWLARRSRIPWVAELRDLWGDNPTYANWRKKIEDRWERSTLTSAAGLVTVSDPLAAVLCKKYHAPVLVSYNGFDPLENPGDPNSLQTKDDRLRIVYTGTIYKNYRDPSPLFLALQRLGSQAQKVRVSFYGPGLAFVLEQAKQLGVDPFVEAHEPVAYDESLRLQAGADVLLLLQWTDAREKGIYTGKLFEYIGAGRPILSVGPTDNEPSQLIVKEGFGVALQDPDAIATQLRRWIEAKQHGGIPDRPREAALRYSRDAQLQRIDRFLQEIAAAEG